ncbi:MAG: ABC-F family ATP-binding cassette domain-containing protein [Caulobacteraceae bacterium]
MARHAVLGMEEGAFHYGARPVFSGISFLIDPARTALVGDNGAGKSTLMACLAGELELNRGKLVRSRGLKTGWLPQEIPAGFDGLAARQVLERALADAHQAWRIEALTDEIGLARSLLEAPFGELSGGWKRLVLIAAAARLADPDILLLDEPTNHLDLSNINTLETWLEGPFASLPLLVISHDRAFLDRMTERTLFLRSDGLSAFKAPFARAREALIERDLAAARQRSLEEKEIARLQKAAARYTLWAVKNPDLNRRKKAIESRVRRIREAQGELARPDRRRLALSEGEVAARAALRIEGLEVAAPGGRALFSIDRLIVGSGDKIALLGANGAGKSTLVKRLAAAFAARLPHYETGAAIRFNPACRLALFDQALAGLDPASSPLEHLTEKGGSSRQEAVRSLARAGFPRARQGEPIAVLSPGERARLVFLALEAARPNFYLLDEPTSHLDIAGQEDLEAELDASDVAALIVSHDRFFIRAAASRFLEIRTGRLVEIEDAEPFFAAQ